ncbi:MAG: thioredoxin fold domain-containing protein [Litoreibacter sp.]
MVTFLFTIFFASLSFAAEIGDDGLHKAPWMRDTFKDLSEDLEEGNTEGKRLLVLVEQRGCIYCHKMHEEVFIEQINMFGDVEVTDFDGTSLPEKDMAKRWGALFTPSIYFFPQKTDGKAMAAKVAVAHMPGAFGRWTTLNMLTWVVERGYNGEERFQTYHARKFEEQDG